MSLGDWMAAIGRQAVSAVLNRGTGRTIKGRHKVVKRGDAAAHALTEQLESRLMLNSALSFLPAATFTAGSNAFCVATGDLDGDGEADMAVADNGGSRVGVVLGNGNGTFMPQATFAVGSMPYSVCVGDFNGDGKADLAVADYAANKVGVLLGNGNGALQTQATFAVGSEPP